MGCGTATQAGADHAGGAGHCAVDEPFRDTARIVGDVPEGAYVTFTAYEAVEEGAVPGMNGVLLDEARAEVDHTLFEQTIASPQVRSPKAGLVYWRASLRSRDGDVLVSHELGVEGETVTVEAPDDPPAEPKADPEPEKPVLSHTGAGGRRHHRRRIRSAAAPSVPWPSAADPVADAAAGEGCLARPGDGLRHLRKAQ